MPLPAPPSTQLVPDTPPAARKAALKWAALGLVLELGYSVLYSDVDVALLRDPFPLLKRDADAEVMSGAPDAESAYGWCTHAFGKGHFWFARRRAPSQLWCLDVGSVGSGFRV